MKVIIDTNVVISGIFWPGVSREILVLLEEKRFQNIISEEIANEYAQVAARIAKKIRFVGKVDELLELIIMNSKICSPSLQVVAPVCRDPNDQMFLDLAVIVKAKYIVSGDKDLHAVGSFGCGKVIKPKEFLNLVFS